MLSVSAQWLNSLRYSHTPVDRIDVFRGGALVAPDLKIAPGTGALKISGGDGQLVRSSLTVGIIDPTGELVPNAMDSPLAPFGSEIRLQMGIRVGNANQMATLGYFPVIETSITEQSGYVERPDEPGVKIWYSRGAQMDMECADRIKYIETNKFTGREQPRYTNVFQESQWLLSDNKPAYGGLRGSVTNRTIPKDTTYDLDRIKALTDMADLLNADGMIDERGTFIYRSKTLTSVAWRLEKGDFSILRQTKRTISSDGFYNGAVEKGQDDNDRVLVAIKVIDTGPLKWGGPYGKVALQHASTLLNTQDSVNAGVETVFQRSSETPVQDIPIECARNPALQWGDYIELPTRTSYVAAQVREINLPIGAKTMTLVVRADPFTLRGLI